jgi:O-glycosyl hydrolase
MKKRVKTIVLVSTITFVMGYGLLNCNSNKTAEPEYSILIDGAERFQQMDGMGVNANTRSWNGDELKPAINLLLESMNFNIWRVVAETEELWEVINDNDDPFNFNREYYTRLYETPKFQKIWDMLGYLNDRGVNENLMLNLMGRIPDWMGDSIILPGFEDEYIEMLVSFVDYAKNTRHLQFGLFAPMNEPDIRREGPTVGAEQFAVVNRKLVDRMNALGLGEVEIVIPDVANMDAGIEEYLPKILASPVIMANVAHIGLHSYGGYYAPAWEYLKKSAYPASNLWMTECNAWRDGLDDGRIGLYDYTFASECVNNMIDLIRNGASACLLWEGYDSYYEHHSPSLFSYWGILGYDSSSKVYTPRKHFYAVSQISKFITKGSWQIGISDAQKGLHLIAFYDPASSQVTLAGINKKENEIRLCGTLANLGGFESLQMHYTDSIVDLCESRNVRFKGKSFQAVVPSNCIFTLTGRTTALAENFDNYIPEPLNWYAGDMHVHRNCGQGSSLLAETEFTSMMEPNDLAVITVLADMGNAEVQDPKTDLPKVNGADAAQSKPGRIVHWDAEWHFDPAGVTFEHKALGGHLVFLGLKEAHQIWDESPYKLLEWGKKQGAISGFCHMQYLNDALQHELTCCIPIDYPVEAALGTIDFLAEDVWLDDAAVNAYYRLLNCGFRLGWAAGTDFPCNGNEPLGSQLTYVQVRNQPLTYQKWIEGIKSGRTIVSMNGHNEFLDLKVGENKAGPGDEINLTREATLGIEVTWTSKLEQNGSIEVVCNGVVIASQKGPASPAYPLILKTSSAFNQSSWICARRMNEQGHQSHTAPVYITVDNAPVRASAEDAQYFIEWIDNILVNIAPGGSWNQYFTQDLDVVQSRYHQARTVYESIEKEAKIIK